MLVYKEIKNISWKYYDFQRNNHNMFLRIIVFMSFWNETYSVVFLSE